VPGTLLSLLVLGWADVALRLLWESQAEIRDTEAIHEEATFYCAGTGLADSCPKPEPWEQRGLTLCTLASRLQKQKTRSNPHMVMYNSIGYFTLMLRDFPPPQCYVTLSTFRFLSFLSLLCHPYLPATFSGLRPSLFSSLLQDHIDIWSQGLLSNSVCWIHAWPYLERACGCAGTCVFSWIWVLQVPILQKHLAGRSSLPVWQSHSMLEDPLASLLEVSKLSPSQGPFLTWLLCFLTCYN
jgi:hypothetical protein